MPSKFIWLCVHHTFWLPGQHKLFIDPNQLVLFCRHTIWNKWKTVECEFHALSEECACSSCRINLLYTCDFTTPNIKSSIWLYKRLTSFYYYFYVLHTHTHTENTFISSFRISAHVKFNTDDWNTWFFFRLHNPEWY